MEQETAKLVNVLRRIARGAGYLAWVKSDPEAIEFCVAQYNRILSRLNELEPGTRTLFVPLAADASAELVRVAARDLAAYFDDEVPEWRSASFAWRCTPRRFRARARCIPVEIKCC